MTRDIVNSTLLRNKRLKDFEQISDFGVDVLTDMMQEFARIKCLEAIKNIRHRSYDLVGYKVTGERNIDKVLQDIQRDIQNIPNQDVMPEL